MEIAAESGLGTTLLGNRDWNTEVNDEHIGRERDAFPPLPRLPRGLAPYNPAFRRMPEVYRARDTKLIVTSR